MMSYHNQVCLHMHTQTQTHTRTHTCICICTHTYTHACKHVHTHTHTCTHNACTYVCLCIMHSLEEWLFTFFPVYGYYAQKLILLNKLPNMLPIILKLFCSNIHWHKYSYIATGIAEIVRKTTDHC